MINIDPNFQAIIINFVSSALIKIGYVLTSKKEDIESSICTVIDFAQEQYVKKYKDIGKYDTFVARKENLQIIINYILHTNICDDIPELDLRNLDGSMATYDQELFFFSYLKDAIKENPILNPYTLHSIITDTYNHTKEIAKNTDKSITLDELKELIATRKDYVKNQAIFPWFKNSLKYQEVFPNLFVHPKFKKRYGECSFKELVLYKNKHIAVLGDAGAGKSTLLRYLFAFDMLENVDCFYLTADEIKNFNGSLFNKLLNNKHNFGKEHPLHVFIDGIDETYSDDPKEYKELIDKIKNINNCFFWIACRSDFFNQTLNESTTFVHESLIIQPWDDLQSEYFINEYSIIIECNDLPERIENMVEKADDLVNFKKNPFQLSLLVFLAENNLENNKVKGLYDLYDKFIEIWIDRELNRDTCKDEKELILKEIKKISRKIYIGKRYKITEMVERNSAIRDLLNIDYDDILENKYASTFYHRSIAAFCLAKIALKAMLGNKEKSLIKVFSCKLKDDVTNFINDAFSTLTNDEKSIVSLNLQSIYEKHKMESKFLVIKEQLIYYLTRLGIDVSVFLLKEINPRPTNPIMRLTLAYGCVLSDEPKVREFALEYAKSIANDSGEDATVNRAWTVIYFGDKIGNPYKYKDNEQCSWEKARKARIKRFTKKEPRLKDYRFRLFDVPLFYSFLKDRKWGNISQSEFELLKQLEFPEEHFNEMERKFLEEQLSLLIKEYESHLNESTLHV